MQKSFLCKSLLVLIVTAFVITSCDSCKHKSIKTRNFICVVDFSSATNSQERQEFYKNVIINNVIKKLSMTDKITVIPVDKATVTNSSEIFIADLAIKDFEPDVASPLEEDKITKDNFEKYKDTLAITFASNFKKAVSDRSLQTMGTDLFGAIQNVKGYIKSSDENYVIFLSDMMNYTPALIMEATNPQFSQSTMDAILNGLPGIELSNTIVIVLTADQPSVSSEHFELVKSFWEKYFLKNNIKLFDYSSASVSKLDELMKLSVSKN